MKKNAIISLAMLYALWQTKRSDLLDLIAPLCSMQWGSQQKLAILLMSRVYADIWNPSLDTNRFSVL